jgi:colicin import membrane protein
MTLATTTAPIVIDKYQALESDIVIAEQQAIESFDYEDKKGNKEARSYVAQLRKHKGRIEDARKAAKAYALEYGRKVDSQAKALVERVEALITPHVEALTAIEMREVQRIEAHRAVIEEIEATVREVFAPGITGTEIQQLLCRIQAIDVSGMEEFTEDGANAKEKAVLELGRHLADAHRREEEAAELARLREEARLREQEQAREQAAAHAREQAQREAEEAVRNAAAREQAERDRAEQAEERARQLEEQARLAEEKEQQRLAAQAEADRIERERREQLQQRAAAQREEKRELLIREIMGTIANCSRREVALLIAHDQIHPAVSVAWGQV